ncbi:hypothetical protein [Muriicola soli]|nr:hypothetical protein [Muriicola soli]
MRKSFGSASIILLLMTGCAQNTSSEQSAFKSEEQKSEFISGSGQLPG